MLDVLKKQVFAWRQRWYLRYGLPRCLPEARRAVWLASFPRSGSHWLMAQLVNALSEMPQAQAHLKEPNDVHRWTSAQLRRRRFGWLKTHAPPLPYFGRVIYLYRHPAETLYSYWRMEHARRRRPEAFPVFLRAEVRGCRPGPFGCWAAHVRAYTQFEAERLLLVPYERLLLDPFSVLHEVLAFSGYPPPSEAHLRWVVAFHFEPFLQQAWLREGTPRGPEESPPTFVLRKQRERSRAAYSPAMWTCLRNSAAGEAARWLGYDC